MLPHVAPSPRFVPSPLTTVILLCLTLLHPVSAWGAQAQAAQATPSTSDSTVSSASPAASELPAHAKPTAILEPPLNAQDDEAFRDRFWLVDPRLQPRAPQPDLMKLEIHGEYQVRYTKLTDARLSDYGFSDYRRDLGQDQRLEHRMRFTPRFSYRRNLAVVAQFDVPHGLLLGHTTDHVAGDPEPTTEAQPMRFAFRWLYADFNFKHGQLTVGQQPARWGMGLIFDSGDERQFFGDPRFGTLVERLGFRGKPFGPNTKIELLVATDWVYSDAKAHWLDGDRDLRAMAGLSYVDHPQRRLGLLVIGERFQPKFTNTDLHTRRPTETTATFDLAGQAFFPVPGQSAYIVTEGEAAMVVGTTDIAPEVLAPNKARVQRLGALARIGAVATRGVGPRRWGKWGVMLEWGYASGDADPSDGVDRRFVSNPARRVGLVLFDEVLRWKAARAQAALEDPRIGQRPSASARTLPTAGGVAGATYLALQWLYRPLPNLDLRASTLVAQACTDLVDPARLVTSGRWANFDEGTPSHRDLGLELDLATELRQPLDNGLGVSIGAEGGVLFPGRALADASGSGMETQALVRGRFGFYF